MESLEAYRQAANRLSRDTSESNNNPNAINSFKEEARRIEHDLSNQLSRTRRILVIGGAGFIGSVLTRRLINRGYSVRILDNLLYDNFSSISDIEFNEEIDFIEGDFLEPKTLATALNGITDIVLLAALVGDPICSKYPEQAIQINQNGTIELIDTLKNYPINKLVFASTCSNYGIHDGIQAATEDAELTPLSIYAETKVAVEKYLMRQRGKLEYAPTILRFATAYGIGQRTRFDLTINHFTRDLALGNKLTVYDEDTYRPYCHINDISDAIISVLEAPRSLIDFQVFNVGSNIDNHSKRGVIEIIKKYLPEASVEYGQNGNDPRDYRVDFSKIESVLNFEPKHSAHTFIADLIDAINNNRFGEVETNPNFHGNYIIPKYELQ